MQQVTRTIFDLVLVVKSDSSIQCTLFVVLVLHQLQVSSCMETTASDIHIPVEMISRHMQPVVELETPNLSR